MAHDLVPAPGHPPRYRALVRGAVRDWGVVMGFADWLNVGGTDRNHPTGIAHHIRNKGIYETIVERAAITNEVLGEDTKLTVWMPFGVNRERHRGKLRFYYDNRDLLGDDWDVYFIDATIEAWKKSRVHVVPYLGKIGWANEAEFQRGGEILEAMHGDEVVLDNLSGPDVYAARRAWMLHNQFSINVIGSEFPETRDRKLSDYGLAIDMLPGDGGNPRGASLAVDTGAIPNGQPLSIVLPFEWKGGVEARIDYWQTMIDDLTLYANLGYPATRTMIEKVIGGP